MREFKSPRESGLYAVVHYGTDGCQQNLPFYANTVGSFTSNIRLAHLSEYRADVDELACKMNEEFRNKGHNLADHVHPSRLLVVPIDYELPRFPVLDNVEDMSFWWFTFGVAHPLERMVQGVYATSENEARKVMIEFYGRTWCSCYKSDPPGFGDAGADVVIGDYRYRPVPKLLKEGDVYQ